MTTRDIQGALGADIPLAPTAQGVVDNERFASIGEFSDLAASYAVSAAEAAWRGDGKAVWSLLGQLALTTCAALEVAEALGKDPEADQ